MHKVIKKNPFNYQERVSERLLQAPFSLFGCKQPSWCSVDTGVAQSTLDPKKIDINKAISKWSQNHHPRRKTLHVLFLELWIV